MAYQTFYDNARTANFLKILEVSLVQNASFIINEDKTTPHHYNRIRLANLVMCDSANWAQIFKDGIAMQGVTDASADSAFDSAIGAVWNGYAGLLLNGALST